MDMLVGLVSKNKTSSAGIERQNSSFVNNVLKESFTVK